MPDETTQTTPDAPPPLTPPPAPKNIHQAIASVMGEVGGVAKGRKNEQQGYKFRGIADVYLACQLVMAKHGMHVVPHRIVDYTLDELKTAKGGQMWRVRIKVLFRACAADGSFVELETLGEAMDTGDKASNKAMSAAIKYALVQLFALPEEDPSIDTETASPETVVKGGQLDLWGRLEKAGVPTDDAACRAWCEKVLGRSLPSPDALTDVDVKLLLDVAEKRVPMPAEKSPPATEAQQKALNAAVDKLTPWGGPAALDGLDNTKAAAKRKNAKLAWASAMLEPPRRIAGFSALSSEECDRLLTRALAGEMPAGDPLPAWMDTQPSPQGTAK